MMMMTTTTTTTKTTTLMPIASLVALALLMMMMMMKCLFDVCLPRFGYVVWTRSEREREREIDGVKEPVYILGIIVLCVAKAKKIYHMNIMYTILFYTAKRKIDSTLDKVC